jgi:hypothetical protein
LCPADETLDEKCFQKTPLKYVNETQALWWDQGPKKDEQVMIDATRLQARDGSIWTKNPIPAMDCPTGGVPDTYAKSTFNCTGPQYTPPLADPLYWGFSSYNLTSLVQEKYMPYIKDFVVVPDVPEGHYVLSWRWDCEQTPQVWNSCSDIYISKSTLLI